MRKEILISEWNRKAHFEFFNSFTEPFFGITTTVDITKAFYRAKEANSSLFLYYMHACMSAVNQVDSFKIRLEEDKIYQYDTIHASTTTNRKDLPFAFAFLPYKESLKEFIEQSTINLDEARMMSGLGMGEENKRLDLVHYSTLPWIEFSSISHPRNFNYKDSVPKITFGKISKNVDRVIIPISIHVHHGIMDAQDVAEFLEKYHQQLNK